MDTNTIKKEIEKYYGDIINKREVTYKGDKAFLLVETADSYDFVSISDYSDQPIGTIEVFVEHRVTKTSDTLSDFSTLLHHILLKHDKQSTDFINKILHFAEQIKDSGLAHQSVLGSGANCDKT